MIKIFKLYSMYLTIDIGYLCNEKWNLYVCCLQVNDFLSGKAPLNLTMRLGDHMMLIQLQLSTVSSSGSSKRLQTAASTVASTGAAAALNTSTVAPEPPQATATAATACSAGNIIGTPRLIPGVDAYPITRVRNVSDDSDDNSMDTSEDVSPATPTPVAAPVEPAVAAPTPTPATPCSCDASTSTASTTTATATGDKPQLDTRALAEASRNLTQTLKQLSSEVLTTKSGSKEVSFIAALYKNYITYFIYEHLYSVEMYTYG